MIFYFLFDIKSNKITERIENIIDFEYMVIAQCKKFISKDESYKIIDKHKTAIDKYMNPG